jgi:hypothetical protein
MRRQGAVLARSSFGMRHRGCPDDRPQTDEFRAVGKTPEWLQELIYPQLAGRSVPKIGQMKFSLPYFCASVRLASAPHSGFMRFGGRNHERAISEQWLPNPAMSREPRSRAATEVGGVLRVAHLTQPFRKERVGCASRWFRGNRIQRGYASYHEQPCERQARCPLPVGTARA